MGPASPTLEAWSLNHWTTREVLYFLDGRGTQSLPQIPGRCSRAERTVCSQGMWRKRTSPWQEERGQALCGFSLCSNPYLLLEQHLTEEDGATAPFLISSCGPFLRTAHPRQLLLRPPAAQEPMSNTPAIAVLCHTRHNPSKAPLNCISAMLPCDHPIRLNE